MRISAQYSNERKMCEEKLTMISSSSNPQVKINPEYASPVSELSPEGYESLK